MKHNNNEEHINAQQDDELLTVVLDCQRYHHERLAADEPSAKEALSLMHRASVERLYQLLEVDLRRKAKGWLRSGIASDVDSLAKSMFVSICFALPRLQVDPKKNLRRCLIVIAERGMYDEYQRAYTCIAGRASGQAPLSVDDPLAQVSDPVSLEAGDRLIAQIDNQACLRVIVGFWRRTLSAVDQAIVVLRMRELSFKDIARQLGDGWVEATVRQRYHRLMLKTRQHLHEQGLLIRLDLL